MADTARQKFFDAINENYSTLLSAVEQAQGQGHKVSQTVIDELRKGEQDISDLTQRWIDSPTSFFENFSAMLDVQVRAQQRALELARDSFLGAESYQQDVRETLQKVIAVNRQAGEATIEAARTALSGAVDTVRDRAASTLETSPKKEQPAGEESAAN